MKRMIPDDAVTWLDTCRGRCIRRRNGQAIYTPLRIDYDSHRGRFVVKLQRLPDRTVTWAPLSDIPKFILCYPTGREVPKMPPHDRDCCDTPAHHDPVAGLADRYDAATLKRALKARRKIDADHERTNAAIRAEREENQRLRQIALDALEKKAKSGDVGAAVELHRLVS